MTTTLRGFTIRFHRAGTDKYQDEYKNTWAPAGETPVEWEQAKQDPEIDQAQLYSSTQRRVRADKRRILDMKGEKVDTTGASEVATTLTYYKSCAFCANECRGH